MRFASRGKSVVFMALKEAIELVKDRMPSVDPSVAQVRAAGLGSNASEAARMCLPGERLRTA
jgi:hypothetical protein